MVVKRSTSHSNSINSRLVLPLTTKDIKENKQLMGQSEFQVPLHVDIDEDSHNVPFWRKWSSSSDNYDSLPKRKRTSDDTDVLPSWANPQDDYIVTLPPLAQLQAQSHSQSLHSSKSSKIILTTRNRKASTWSIVIGCLLVIGVASYWHLKATLRLIVIETGTVLSVRNQINIKLRSAEKDLRVLSREVAVASANFDLLQHELKLRQSRVESIAQRDLTEAQTSLSTMKRQVGQFHEHKSRLMEGIQRQSRRAVENQYGKDKTIQVEFTLAFPDKNSQGDGTSSFVVEMASLDLMPHSVDVFLTMISLGLWDNCSFVMHAGHMIKAAPYPYQSNLNESASATKLANAFDDHNLNGPLFTEYHPMAFAHTAMTIAFSSSSTSGVHGDGPSFYINTEDNTDLHHGESAFGKIVSGYDTLKRLSNIPKESEGIWLKHRVGIKSTKIVVI